MCNTSLSGRQKARSIECQPKGGKTPTKVHSKMLSHEMNCHDSTVDPQLLNCNSVFRGSTFQPASEQFYHIPVEYLPPPP